ncbi:amino acid adenylation domain-containing protein [Streptomyces albus subsp. chlorinus]|uniref:non-ribosomal peptide synthetase n=1 Tax=Streptomyces albus TaxID=1888 RepID=UPI001570B56F|nr:non-ribosomal peptide synthetase [Streptomyces albus]NSC25521.1 amino acid adenylation domain-containing protein [Streptomyces albus subsp. chlorinus]
MTSTRLPGDLAFPSSPGQRRLWFLHQVSPESVPAYALAARVDLHGDLHADDLQHALNQVVARHEALRTALRQSDEGLLQIVQEGVSVVLQEVEPSGDGAEDRARELDRVLRHLARRGWDLGRPPLMRAALVRLSDRHAVLGLCVHHAVCDGLSLQVLLGEIFETYRQRRTGQAQGEPEPPLQFADFVVWSAGGDDPDEGWRARQRELLDAWCTRLAGLPDGIDLPTDRRRPARQSFEGARVPFTLGREETDRLRGAARHCGVSLSSLLLTAYLTVLHRAAGSDDIAVGIPVANRCRPELATTVGYLANTCVLRARFDAPRTLRQLAQRVHEEIGWLMQHSDLPFGDLVEALNPPRLLDRNPLFSVMFGFQPDAARHHDMPGLRAEMTDLDTGTSRLDLSLFLFEEPQGAVSGFLEYATALFDAATVERLGRHMHTVLGRLAACPDDEVAAALRDAAAPWPRPPAHTAPLTTVSGRIHQHTRVRPDAPALRDDTTTLTYRQLDAYVTAAAARLRAAGAGPGRRVAVHTARGVGTVVSMLAAWRTGAVHVPVDPALPARRRELIMRQAAPAVVVTSPDTGEVPRTAAAEDTDTAVSVPVDSLLDGAGDAVDERVLCAPESVAYLMFTSGSTGEPKAIAVTHANLAYFLDAVTSVTGLSADDTLLALTTHAFDISLLELLAPLTVGGTVTIAPQHALRDGAELRRRLETGGITIAQATPATWRLLTDTGWRPGPDLTVLCGGEALPPDLADLLADGSAASWNLYGPTETTIWSCAARLRPGAAVHLGEPLPGTTAVVVDQDLRPVPDGTSGELVIGGPGVAAGYAHRPGLTAARFLPDPRGGGGRLYRTGDKARRRADGSLEFLGRMDDQVKVRGNRIELGEVEQALRTAPGVRDAAAALLGQGGDALLGAWLVPAPGVTADAEWAAEVRRHAAARLPGAAVPARYHAVDAVPLTPHGKTDRRLLARTGTRLDMPSARIEPRNRTEAEVAALWQKLLGLSDVGATDDFFLLGGHSLLASQMIQQIKAAFGVTVPMTELFLEPTVAHIARSVAALRGNTAGPAAPAPRAEEPDWDFDSVPRRLPHPDAPSPTAVPRTGRGE